MTKYKEYPCGVMLADYGEPEYLDGVLMQFGVSNSKGSLAYFADKRDAELFAKAKAAGLKP